MSWGVDIFMERNLCSGKSFFPLPTCFWVKISAGRVTSTWPAGLFSASTSEAAIHMNTARMMLRLSTNAKNSSPPRQPLRPSRRWRIGGSDGVQFSGTISSFSRFLAFSGFFAFSRFGAGAAAALTLFFSGAGAAGAGRLSAFGAAGFFSGAFVPEGFIVLLSFGAEARLPPASGAAGFAVAAPFLPLLRSPLSLEARADPLCASRRMRALRSASLSRESTRKSSSKFLNSSDMVLILLFTGYCRSGVTPESGAA